MSETPSLARQKSRFASSLRQSAAWVVFFLAALVIFSLLIHSALGKNRIGADFFIYWNGGRAVTVDHASPYQQDVTLQIQQGIYGRPALPDEDQVAFAYPLHSLFLLIPFVWLPFDWAQSSWMAFHLMALLGALLFAFRRSPKGLVLTTLLFYPIVFGLLLGNFAVIALVILLITFALLLDRATPSRTVQIILGLLLTFVTIKPQLTWFFLGFILLLSIRKRMIPLLAGFFGGLLVEMIISWLIVPGWPVQWLNLLKTYSSYVPGQPPVEIYLGYLVPPNSLGVAITILAVLVGLATLYFLFRWWQGKLASLALLAWGGLITYFFHPSGLAYDQYAMLLPLLLWAFSARRKVSPGYLLFWVTALALSWVAFAVGRWVYHPADTWPLLLYAGWVIWMFRRKIPAPAILEAQA